jgi:AraC-like DNA-binding protein
MAAVLQKSADNQDSGGHLDPAGFQQHIIFHTYPPPASLASFVDHCWVLSWDRASQPPYISEQVMHRPYFDVYVSREESGIQCTFRGKRGYRAAGTGRIIGARFRPGAFHAFWHGSLAGLQDKTIDIQQVFPEADTHYVDQLLSLDDQAAVQALARTIQTKDPEPDPNIECVAEIIATIEADDSIQTVRAVARRFQRSERWIQQLFQEYVGIGLKWLLQRNKLLAAARHIRENDKPDWAALAYDLGYSSQQHFITNFKRVLGKTPVQYKRDLTLQQR